MVIEYFGMKGVISPTYDEWLIGDIKEFDVCNDKICSLGMSFEKDFPKLLKETIEEMHKLYFTMTNNASGDWKWISNNKRYNHAWAEDRGKVKDWQTMKAGSSKYAGKGWPSDHKVHPSKDRGFYPFHCRTLAFEHLGQLF